MIRGRFVFLIATAVIISSLIISGCVSPPTGTPTPAVTPVMTPTATPIPPTPTPGYSVEILSAPATADAGQSFMVTLRVNSPVQENINYVAVHYGPVSKSGNLTSTSYPSRTTPQSGAIPANFSANITSPPLAGAVKTGTIYLRAHAIINGTNYWSDEKTINITRLGENLNYT